MQTTQNAHRRDPNDFSYTFNGRKNQWNEYVVRCYKWGKRYPDGDYFADDKTDAQQTFDHLNKAAAPQFING